MNKTRVIPFFEENKDTVVILKKGEVLSFPEWESEIHTRYVAFEGISRVFKLEPEDIESLTQVGIINTSEGTILVYGVELVGRPFYEEGFEFTPVDMLKDINLSKVDRALWGLWEIRKEVRLSCNVGIFTLNI